MPDNGLSPRSLDILRQILAPFAQRIARIGLFGSRATGVAKDNSDIDLVLYGVSDQALVDRLATLFEESSPAVSVDVVAYDLIDEASLRAHIDAHMTSRYEREDLASASREIRT